MAPRARGPRRARVFEPASSSSASETELCLAWLAAFHATFLGESPVGLWPVGTYWHLGTRQEELRAMKDERLRAVARELDRRLSSARYQTFVHGDAKPANFCFGGGRGRGGRLPVRGRRLRDEGRGLSGERRPLPGLSLPGPSPPSRAGGRRRCARGEWRELFPIARMDYERFLDGWR